MRDRSDDPLHHELNFYHAATSHSLHFHSENNLYTCDVTSELSLESKIVQPLAIFV